MLGKKCPEDWEDFLRTLKHCIMDCKKPMSLDIGLTCAVVRLLIAKDQRTTSGSERISFIFSKSAIRCLYAVRRTQMTA